jgi:hypothetical protein
MNADKTGICSHEGTKNAKKSGAEMVSYLCGFVALCENQVFVFQGLVFPYIQNLRQETRFEQVVVRRGLPGGRRHCERSAAISSNPQSRNVNHR